MKKNNLKNYNFLAIPIYWYVFITPNFLFVPFFFLSWLCIIQQFLIWLFIMFVTFDMYRYFIEWIKIIIIIIIIIIKVDACSFFIENQILFNLLYIIWVSSGTCCSQSVGSVLTVFWGDVLLFQELFNLERWTQLVMQFRRENYQLHQLNDQSTLAVTLQAGLSALKTPYPCFIYNTLKCSS